MVYELPPLPPTIHPLLNADSDRLREKYGALYASPVQCPTCQGKKSFRWYAHAAFPPGLAMEPMEQVDYTCPCDDQWLLYRFLLNSGIGLAYQRLGWEDLKATPEWVHRYIDNASGYIHAGMGLVLYGQYGTGKSLLCQLILKDLISKGVNCHYVSMFDLIQKFTSGWTSTEDKEWFERRLKHAGVLAIDDIGREHKQGNTTVTAMSISTVEEVLRHRLAQAMPTFLTSNLDLHDIGVSYGPNVDSLLKERSITQQFLGEDYRPTYKGGLKAEIVQGLTRPIVLR